jgi:hypothetical protein
VIFCCHGSQGQQGCSAEDFLLQKGGWIMRMTARQIEEWLYRNQGKIILCPFQPGNLRITQWACRKRKMQARKEDLTAIMQGDYFDYVYKNGLLRCRDCRIAGTFPHRSSCGSSFTAGHAAA